MHDILLKSLKNYLLFEQWRLCSYKRKQLLKNKLIQIIAQCINQVTLNNEIIIKFVQHVGVQRGCSLEHCILLSVVSVGTLFIANNTELFFFSGTFISLN